jgi:DegV family protein with EDD domain
MYYSGKLYIVKQEGVMTVKIIADSACDLPKELTDEYAIDIIPLIVYIGDEEFKDGVALENTKRMYDHMKNGGTVKTAQVPYEEYKERFEKYIDTDTVCIYIGFSSELSGTFQTSCIVANEIKEEHPDFDITCIDSLSASIGVGLIVLKAAKMAKEGKSKEEIIEMIHFYIEHVEHIFTVDALEYLYRGGRVSKASAIIGDMLNIKPILDVEEGKLIPIEKIRGRKKSINRMIEITGERGDRLSEQVVAINHADDLEIALYMKEKLHEKYGINEFVIREVGAVIGSHSGPGTASIFFLNKLDDQVI